MATSNVDAIFAENRSLSKIIPRSKVSNACVKRWSEEFLNSTCRTYPDAGSEQIYFVDQHGEKVGQVDPWWVYYLGVGGHLTVGQALSRLTMEEQRRIHYAVGDWNGDVILWRLPNGYDDVWTWRAATTRKAREELRQTA